MGEETIKLLFLSKIGKLISVEEKTEFQGKMNKLFPTKKDYVKQLFDNYVPAQKEVVKQVSDIPKQEDIDKDKHIDKDKDKDKEQNKQTLSKPKNINKAAKTANNQIINTQPVKKEIVLTEFKINDKVYYRDEKNRIWNEDTTLAGVIDGKNEYILFDDINFES